MKRGVLGLQAYRHLYIRNSRIRFLIVWEILEAVTGFRINFKHLISFCLTLHYYNLSTVFEGFKTEDKSKTFMILTEAYISSYTAATGKLNFDIRVTE